VSEVPQGGARATGVSVGTAETVALQIGNPGGSSAGPVNIDNPTLVVSTNNLIRVFLNYTPGSATAPIVRCRRVNLTGTQVGNSYTPVAGFNTFFFQDLGDPTPQGGYVITISTSTAAGTATEIIGSYDDGT
jgi:hypothetical protein